MAKPSSPKHRPAGCSVGGRSRRMRLAAALAVAALALLARASPGQAQTPAKAAQPAKLELLQVFSLAADAGGPDAPLLRELSGADHDAQRGQWLLASDRGLLWWLAVEGASAGAAPQPRIAAWLRLQAQPRVNAESVVWHEAAAWVADERRHRILKIGPQGEVLQELRYGGALADADALAAANRGVEALAWGGAQGWLAVPQRSLKGSPQALHTLYGQYGGRWQWHAMPGRVSVVKGLAALGEGRLLVLEQYKREGQTLVVLRPLLLAQCEASGPACEPEAWPLDDPRLSGANLEGLACTPQGLCLLVADSGPEGERSLLALLRVEVTPPPAR
jgi:hypothetical protein